jgi:hypothetical protein
MVRWELYVARSLRASARRKRPSLPPLDAEALLMAILRRLGKLQRWHDQFAEHALD